MWYQEYYPFLSPPYLRFPTFFSHFFEPFPYFWMTHQPKVLLFSPQCFILPTFSFLSPSLTLVTKENQSHWFQSHLSSKAHENNKPILGCKLYEWATCCFLIGSVTHSLSVGVRRPKILYVQTGKSIKPVIYKNVSSPQSKLLF